MTAFAAGKRAVAICDRCGFRFPLRKLVKQMTKQRDTGLLVCSSCLDPDHPQLMLGTFPVYDPQALRNPRPDAAMLESRDIYWGWNPLMGVTATGEVGTVQVQE
jgi:hypothetical protein